MRKRSESKTTDVKLLKSEVAKLKRQLQKSQEECYSYKCKKEGLELAQKNLKSEIGEIQKIIGERDMFKSRSYQLETEMSEINETVKEA